MTAVINRTRPRHLGVGTQGSRTRNRKQRAGKIKQQELAAFARQLGALLHAGIPVVACLQSLSRQSRNPALRELIDGLIGRIEGGESVSEALTHYPRVFDDLFISMIRAGESSGQLSEAALRVAGFLQASVKLRRRVKSAMSYPAVVLSLALVIATLMLIFIVPVFAKMFEGLDAALPGPTQFLINAGDFVRSRAPWLAATFAAVIVIFRRWRRTPAGDYAMDRATLSVPVFGPLMQKVAVSRFARTFAELTRCGVPILKTLEIVAGATGNRVLEHVVLGARATVEEGRPLSCALEKSPHFPVMAIDMLAAGERAGKVDDMMSEVADFYDEEVEATLEGLMALLEPFLIVLLGAIIGSIVVCMFLPIFKLPNAISV